jgi:hypothetical protein
MTGQSSGWRPPYYRGYPNVAVELEDPWTGGDGPVSLSGSPEPRKRGTPKQPGLQADAAFPFWAFLHFVRPAATASAVKKLRVQRDAPSGNRQSPAGQ